jgi:hypothetical protein
VGGDLYQTVGEVFRLFEGVVLFLILVVPFILLHGTLLPNWHMLSNIHVALNEEIMVTGVKSVLIFYLTILSL